VSDALHAQHAAELSLIEPLARDLGFDATLDDDEPALAIDLGDDGSGGHRVMMLTIESADLFADTEDLHFTVVLPFDVSSERVDEARQAIPIVNAAMSLGSFSMAGAAIAFEHVLTVDNSATVADDVLRDLIPALVDEQERFGDYLEGVVDDEISVVVLADLIAAG
jgi:hypothetical protein